MLSSERLNYTQARDFCRDQNASLAHVISEERTEGLGKFVSRDLPSFVGLSNNDKERIWKNEFGIRENLFSKTFLSFDNLVTLCALSKVSPCPASIIERGVRENRRIPRAASVLRIHRHPPQVTTCRFGEPCPVTHHCRLSAKFRHCLDVRHRDDVTEIVIARTTYCDRTASQPRNILILCYLRHCYL